MSIIGKPEWISKERFKRHIQAILSYLSVIFMATGLTYFVATEDWPLWKMCVAVVIIACGAVAAFYGLWWLVWVWQ